MTSLILNGNTLTIEQLTAVAFQPDIKILLSDEAREQVRRARRTVESWVEKREIVYGVTTGFGEFANVVIPPEDLDLLQENLIISHSAGAGEFLLSEIVRAMMTLRVNALAKGHSGIREETLDTLLAMLNKNLLPAVPSQGSVGSSGDLAQLSHIALALIGRGSILNGHTTIPSHEAMMEAGIKPVKLKAKEGLALINGTQMMCAIGALSVAQAMQLADAADIAGAFSLDALRGTDRAFDERIHRLRGFSGQMQTAANLRMLLSGSEIRDSHKEGDGLVQDAYSLRCMPQVHGASRDAIGYVKSVIAMELNSANDNPLIFPETDEHIEGGNFHGQPLALALDFLAIACAELGNISERRTERMVNGALSNGLPRFLAQRGGVESGMMIAQYTSASIASENKTLCHPASVDSIPTSANQEDHNSMGSIAAHKVRKVADNVETILAIELLCAAQAIEFHRPLRTSEPLEAVLQMIRSVVPPAKGDRVVYHDIQAVKQLLHQGKINLAAKL